GQVVDALERTFALVALRDRLQVRVSVIPAVIGDVQDAGLRGFRPPDIPPLVFSRHASLVQNVPRLRRCNDERRSSWLRPVAAAARPTFLENPIEALHVSEIGIMINVEVVEIGAVVEAQADPTARVQARWRVTPGDLGNLRKPRNFEP